MNPAPTPKAIALAAVPEHIRQAQFGLMDIISVMARRVPADAARDVANRMEAIAREGHYSERERVIAESAIRMSRAFALYREAIANTLEWAATHNVHGLPLDLTDEDWTADRTAAMQGLRPGETERVMAEAGEDGPFGLVEEAL